MAPKFVDPTYERYLREVLEWSTKGLKRRDPATMKIDPDFWEKYKEWKYYNDQVIH